ncbi:MAG: sel1 repeat family protein [Gammaproteobacteria bacterium]|nr:sel1 repeat family protein [Gammaproteobacteria bacterium]
MFDVRVFLDIGRILGLVTALVYVQPALACGWWGDGESDDLLRALTVRADGTIAREEDSDREPPEAMIRIGDRFRTGSGGLRDLPMAVYWYRAAAQRSFAPGQYNLAMMYEQGLGVAQNYDQAAQWYRRAAEQGDVHAQHHLGELYQQGRGVPLDAVKAAYWFLRAAEQGHSDVFATVAGLYWEGNGVPRDELLARVWWRLAADHGDASVLGDMRAAGTRLGPEAVARVQELVDEWKRRWH